LEVAEVVVAEVSEAGPLEEEAQAVLGSMNTSRILSTLTNLLEIGLCASVAVTAYQALSAPAEHATFLSQSFEFWLVAELLSIHSVGMFSTRAREKFSLRTTLLLFFFYVAFMAVVTVVFSQWLLGAFLIATLTVRAIRSYYKPETAGTDLAVRAVVFLFTLFTATFAIEFMGRIIPDLVATSDPAYMAIMGKSGFVVWVIEYYALVALLSFVVLVKSLVRRRKVSL
jgi:hypothetical protein